jgi:hypothetical protein
MKKKIIKKNKKKPSYVHVYGSNDGKNMFPMIQNIELFSGPLFIDVNHITHAHIILTKGKKKPEPLHDWEATLN